MSNRNRTQISQKFGARFFAASTRHPADKTLPFLLLSDFAHCRVNWTIGTVVVGTM